MSSPRPTRRTELARCLLAGVLALLAAGCAEVPKVMQLDENGIGRGPNPVWPAQPEVPRYMYLGQLTGEDNFRDVRNEQREGVSKVFAWLVGLGFGEKKPVVLQRPQSGMVDERGRVYVTDVSRQAVFVFDDAEARLEVWEFATGTTRFVAPIGIAAGRDGEVLVTDAELKGVFRLGPDGRPRGAFGQDVLVRPTGIARDPVAGLVYVADTRANDIKIFDDDGVLVDYIGRSGDSEGELNAPTYLAYSNRQLYVTDTLNSRVQVFDAQGNVHEVFGQRGLYVGNLARPKGIAVDDEGNIYVVESYYDHLLIFDRDGRLLLPIGGTGNEPGQFYLPAGVWVDARNRVFVADMFNGRIAVFQFLGGS